ncbi:MAG: FMN-binding negative transcriptional regulator [Planctomycetia bacterium]|nr:FMN-binding negative transcriptional regulator [Planctomycetia bacterium]
MYSPDHFRETDHEKIFDFVERNGFASLVTSHDGLPFASHLPLHLRRDSAADVATGRASLVGHMARSNPQWRDSDGQTALVIFNGPHAYVSPTWYGEPNTVPTWNYIAVHAYGTIEFTEDPLELRRILRDSVALYERALPQPWEFDPTSALSEALVKQIVGFRITVERWEGKWKLNQNQSEVRRRRVAATLAARDDAQSQAVAEWMQRSLGPDKPSADSP